MTLREARRRLGRFAVGLFLGLPLALSIVSPAHAAESLDPSFGKGGISFPGLGGDIRGLAQDADGRLIGGGGARSFVSRYLSDGALDLGFGSGGGRAITPGLDSLTDAVAIQPDGKILAVGSTESGNFVLVRYEDDGQRLDPSFGGELRGTSKQPGRTVTIAGHLGGGAQDVELQPNGRILAAGFGIDNHHRWKAMVTAYRPNGAPDRRFDRNGIASFTTTGGLPIELVSVEALPSGRILAAGDVSGRIMVLRLLPNGKLDPSFSRDGIAYTSLDGARHCICEYATDMEIDRRGRIVVAANATVPRSREPTMLLRFHPDGRLDRSFGKRGIARATLGTRLASKALAIQPDNRIVLAGTYNVPGSGEARVAAARLLPNGRIDRSFTRRGFFTRDFGYEGVAYAALTQRDGKVVIAGRANSGPSPFPEDPSVYDTAGVFLIRFLG
jgi:uncharacterized delta-60 repeat protein